MSKFHLLSLTLAFKAVTNDYAFFLINTRKFLFLDVKRSYYILQVKDKLTNSCSVICIFIYTVFLFLGSEAHLPLEFKWKWDIDDDVFGIYCTELLISFCPQRRHADPSIPSLSHRARPHSQAQSTAEGSPGHADRPGPPQAVSGLLPPPV